MSAHRGYKRTKFDDEDTVSNGGTPSIDFVPSTVFKSSLNVWQRRTAVERALLILILIFTITVVVLACILAAKNADASKIQKPQNSGLGVCLSRKCITVASCLLNAMDPETDPCNNFYQYACGGWIRSHPIPSGHPRWGTFGVLWQENQIQMKAAIEKPLSESASLTETKAKQYYQSCLDVNKTVEELGAKPLLNMMSTVGTWNISALAGSWDARTWDFQKTLERVKLLDLMVMFSVWVGEDDRNSSKNILQVDQGGLGLPSKEYYLNKTIDEDEVLSAYLKYMTEVGTLLGGEENDTKEQMTEVILFETQLANITIPAEERRDEEKLYHKITIKQIQKIAPFINWLHMINTLMSVANITVNSSLEVVVYAPSFLENVSNLVKDMLKTEEGKRTINNYLIWHVVRGMVPYLSKPFRNARKILTEALSGVEGGEEAWRYCITDTDSALGFALGAMFVREAFRGDSKEKAEKMIAEVKTAFKANLPRLRWMDPKTRAAAVDKANAIIDMIGFPEYIMNATKIDKEYARLKINSSEYFENNLRNLKFVLTVNMEQLKKTPRNNVWGMTPPTVNAYYTPSKNQIVFPAGILQAPFYDHDFPKSLNFGAMGMVMGHELTHAFDDQGREYDKFGNLRPWWKNSSVVEFNKHAQCMIKQYSSYKLNGENLRGKKTLGENIADNGGLKSAYHAYEDWIKIHGTEQPLPALNLTHRQLFFLGFAQVWCSTSTKEADHLQLLSDPHSPGKFRVIGTLSNSREFAEQYKCPLGTPMNPIHKCEVW